MRADGQHVLSAGGIPKAWLKFLVCLDNNVVQLDGGYYEKRGNWRCFDHLGHIAIAATAYNTFTTKLGQRDSFNSNFHLRAFVALAGGGIEQALLQFDCEANLSSFSSSAKSSFACRADSRVSNSPCTNRFLVSTCARN